MPSWSPASTPHVARAFSRIGTALIGGYVFAAVAASLIARLLPVAAVEGTAWGLTLGFALYAAVLLWGLAARRLGQVVLTIWGGAAVGLALLLMLGRPA